ncbi:hypothetical protein [Flavivirga spongiicola]|uniref:Helix-turn-helix domain-containing protein n=1 Tax=Flavivirga spongiicola TaxID=421621 RepID=A0ABU7XN00_9FLAO|nr:hypothetical protein [Flavivirga sp. MEBiC05379]MDO5981575.1 hypothetical protein [Flavivirga sp. MEBiC05379]
MTYSERKEKEKHLLFLIERGWLTSLEKVAIEYGCSLRTVERMLNELRNEGTKICYCRSKKRYFLKKE